MFTLPVSITTEVADSTIQTIPQDYNTPFQYLPHKFLLGGSFHES